MCPAAYFFVVTDASVASWLNNSLVFWLNIVGSLTFCTFNKENKFSLSASNEIHRLCPYDKGAIIWYDNCLLKYSNKNFLGQIDNENLFSLLNVQNVSDPTIFNQKTRELLSQLATEASVTTKKYAAGHIELGESTNVYGLAQCTWDLSSNDCFQCLEDAIGQLPSCCDGKEGGRVVGGSCNIRYEIYPFLSS
ncbi:antimicrobial ginkbilobin-2-like protein [Quercus suber]|uniref:Cysteine-rich repeat secretory protein 38 n=1 Tax=Quercus suber TaxID=58331 RepID=A0AAW0M6M4_QUESU